LKASVLAKPITERYSLQSLPFESSLTLIYKVYEAIFEICLQGGDRLPPKIYESKFIHHDFVRFGKKIRDLRPFCRLLFVKCTSSLLQQRSPCETWLPNMKSPP